VTVFLEKYCFPILTGLTLLVLVTNPMHFNWPQRIACLLAVLILAAVVSWAIHHRNKNKAPVLTPSTQSDGKDDRVFVPIKTGDLMGIYRGHTNIQANKLAASYLGKWIRVSGTVNDISVFGDGDVSLSLNTAPDPWPHHLRFSSEWLRRLEILPRGYDLTVEGKIEEIQRHHLVLVNCVLVEASEKA
jgi:hypothetical protein